MLLMATFLKPGSASRPASTGMCLFMIRRQAMRWREKNMDNERQSRDFAGWKIISSPMLFKLISQYNISFGFFFF